MFYDFYQETQAIVYDNNEKDVRSKGEVKKTMFSSRLNKVRSEDDQYIKVHDYTKGIT